MEGKEIIKEEVLELSKNYNSSFHNHTEVSLGDGVTTAEQLVKRAVEIGAEVIGVSDHGNCANWLPVYNAAKAAGIRSALGVEVYLENEQNPGRYNHFLCTAKNYEGIQDISRLVSAANRNLQKRRNGDMIPVVTDQMLSKIATGNVIVTSACIAGPVADPLMDWTRVDREIIKEVKKMEKLEIPAESVKAEKVVAKFDDELGKIRDKIKWLRPQTKVPSFKKTENKIAKMEEGADKAFLLKSLENEKTEAVEKAERAAKELEKLKTEIDEIKQSDDYKDAKKQVKKAVDIQKKIDWYKEKIEELEASKKTEDDMMHEAIKIARHYQKLFGDDFYMEVQYHGIPVESFVYPREVKVARELGIKLIAANDSHIPTKEYMEVRTMLENIRYIKNAKEYKKEQVGDSELYIKSGREVAEALLQILEPDEVLEALENTKAVADQINIVWSDKKHYPSFENAKGLLRSYCEKGVKKRYPGCFTAEMRKQMEYELGVIDQMGYNDYFCEVIDFIKYAKDHALRTEDGKFISVEIGPGRGSGAGSIVCYLTGITEIDPMKYGLKFERFLNPDRVSMPDIDTDFSKHAREITIKYVTEKYGSASVAGIMTRNSMGARNAIDYAAKVLGLKNCGEKRTYVPLATSMKKVLPDKPDVTLVKYRSVIEESFGGNEIAVEILRRAELLEGLTTSFGKHAAGIIIGDGSALENYIPIMCTVDKDGEKSFVIQADMVQAEAQLGFIKMDFLGLKNLNIISYCMQEIMKNKGEVIDQYHLPFEDEVFKNIFAEGDTNFVFQFESAGMKRMLKEFKPTCFEDIILLVACYRPGPMQFLQDEGNSVNVIKVKNGITPVTYLVPELEPILKDTYGGIIYQEQVMTICVQLAGYSIAQADEVRRYMSKKKTDKLEHEKPVFIYGDESRGIPGCVAKGIPADKADELFTMMEDFGRYAFNKAHAACYALVSYNTAYLKYHYFREYMCGVLTEQGDKTAQLVEDCRKRHVRIYAPDINISDVNFHLYQDGIIFGLTNIKQVNNFAEKIVEERKENGVFNSIEDFVQRMRPDAGALEALCMSGAMDVFGIDRAVLHDYCKKYSECYKNEQACREKLENLNAVDITDFDEKEIKKHNGSVKTAEGNLAEASRELSEVTYDRSLVMETSEKLDGEMEFLGLWVSGNPLDDYNLTGYSTCDVEEGKATVAGIVSGLKTMQRKSDGSVVGMKFTLTDKDSGKISVVIFNKNYEEVKDILKDGAVLAVEGKIQDDPDWGKQMTSYSVAPIAKKDTYILFTVKDYEEKAKLYDLLQGYKDVSGCCILIFNEMMQETQSASFRVNKDILNRQSVKARMLPMAMAG